MTRKKAEAGTHPRVPELDGDDDPIAAHVYVGTKIIETIIIQPGDWKYEVYDGDGKLLTTSRTQDFAVRLGDMFLEGYLQGYSDHKEIAHVSGPIWRDRRESGPPEGDGRDRDDDQGIPEGDRPG